MDVQLGTTLDQPWTQDCVEGQWPKTSTMPTEDTSLMEPVSVSNGGEPKQCVPVCAPLCMNGGKCVRPNECECTPEFEGPTCMMKKPQNCSDLPLSVTNGYAIYK